MSLTPRRPIDDTEATLKILLVGNSNVGKSSLLLRFTEDQFLSDEVSATIGRQKWCMRKLYKEELFEKNRKNAITHIDQTSVLWVGSYNNILFQSLIFPAIYNHPLICTYSHAQSYRYRHAVHLYQLYYWHCALSSIDSLGVDFKVKIISLNNKKYKLTIWVSAPVTSAIPGNYIYS